MSIKRVCFFIVVTGVVTVSYNDNIVYYCLSHDVVNNFSPEQCRIEMHQSQPTTVIQMLERYCRPYRLMKTSSKQSKRRDLHVK